MLKLYMQTIKILNMVPKLMGKMEDYARAKKSINFLQDQIRFTDEQNRRIQHHISQLRSIGFEGKILEKFESYIRETDDDLLSKIRLLPLISKWGAKKNDVISLFLHAADIGLLDLSLIHI